MIETIYNRLISLLIFSSILIAAGNGIIEKVNAEVGISSISRIDSERVVIDIYSINKVPIAGVQFEIQPNDLFEIDSVSGGICSEAGFSLHSNKRGLLLGFSLKGKSIPKSASSEIKDNLLFSVYGRSLKDVINQSITLKTTLAGKKGNKINAVAKEYIYTSTNSDIDYK